MIFAFLLFASAFLLEGVATYLSITGLVATFSMSWSIVTLAIALDAAKLSAVTFVYKYWERVHAGMKVYLLPAVVVLMLITAVGSYGFLIEHFQQAIQNTKENDVKLQVYAEEKARLEARKLQIDNQIARLPENMVTGRQRLINAFKSELNQVNARITELDQLIPELKLKQVAQQTHVGPIAVLATALNVPLEVAIQWIVILIVLVMDPLAIVLILAGNRLLEIQRERRGQDEGERHKKALEDELFNLKQQKIMLEEKRIKLEEAKLNERMAHVSEEAVKEADMPSASPPRPPAADHEPAAPQVPQSRYASLYGSDTWPDLDGAEPSPSVETREKLSALVSEITRFPDAEAFSRLLGDDDKLGEPSADPGDARVRSALDDVSADGIVFFTEKTGGHNPASSYKIYSSDLI